MTEISFHFNVPSRVSYACRLLRKARRQGLTAVVTGTDDDLATLDRELWTFAATEFVAHAWAGQALQVPARLHRSTVWLAAKALDAPIHEALVNLGEESPHGFESFQRVFELVSVAESEREAARVRWKSYAKRGYAIKQHKVTS